MRRRRSADLVPVQVVREGQPLFVPGLILGLVPGLISGEDLREDPAADQLGDRAPQKRRRAADRPRQFTDGEAPLHRGGDQRRIPRLRRHAVQP
jgi:hypothetical protein